MSDVIENNEPATTEVATTNPGTTEVPMAQEGNKQVNFTPVFPVIMTQVDNAGLPYADMVADSLALAGTTQNYEGGFTTYFTGQELEGQIRGIAELKEAIYGVATTFMDEMKYEYDRDACMINLWVSVIKEGGYHGPHTHPRAMLAGTYYAEVEDSGAPIVFLNPTYSVRMHDAIVDMKDWNEYTAPKLTLTPKIDTLMIWPAWLEHEVPQSPPGAKPRVAFSFNVDFLMPGQLPK